MMIYPVDLFTFGDMLSSEKDKPYIGSITVPCHSLQGMNKWPVKEKSVYSLGKQERVLFVFLLLLERYF